MLFDGAVVAACTRGERQRGGKLPWSDLIRAAVALLMVASVTLIPIAASAVELPPAGNASGSRRTVRTPRSGSVTGTRRIRRAEAPDTTTSSSRCRAGGRPVSRSPSTCSARRRTAWRARLVTARGAERELSTPPSSSCTGPAPPSGPGSPTLRPAPGSRGPRPRTSRGPPASRRPGSVRDAERPGHMWVYVVRSQVLTVDPLNPGGTGDDQNGWKLRVGNDNDADPNNAPPANYDNPDGVAGTNDELVIGMAQVVVPAELRSGRVPDVLRVHEPGPGVGDVQQLRHGRQHPAALLRAGRSRLRPQRERRAEPWARCRATPCGTTAGRSPPASATRSRRRPPGWWRIVNCISNGNQLIQEGQPGVLSYYTQPPTPNMTLTKTDGVANAAPGQALTYTITATNNSPAATGGAANNVVVTDTHPGGIHLHGVLDPDADTGHVDVLPGGGRRHVHRNRMDQPRGGRLASRDRHGQPGRERDHHEHGPGQLHRRARKPVPAGHRDRRRQHRGVVEPVDHEDRTRPIRRTPGSPSSTRSP